MILSLPLSFVRSLGTFIAISVVDTRGRRAVLLRSLPVLSFAMILISLFTWMNLSADGLMYNVGKWGALVSMVLFLVTFSSGLATIPWLINSEIYPIFLVGTASSIAAFTNWITNFIMTSAFFSSNYVITLAVTAGITIVFWFFIYFFLKETRGNSIRKNVALLLNKTIHDANKMVDKSQAKIMMASVPATPSPVES